MILVDVLHLVQLFSSSPFLILYPAGTILINSFPSAWCLSYSSTDLRVSTQQLIHPPLSHIRPVPFYSVFARLCISTVLCTYPPPSYPPPTCFPTVKIPTEC